MDTKTHYLTIATFRVKDSDDGLNAVTIDDHIPDQAIIRKLCICGSGIEFKEDGRKWLCSASGTELEVNCWNCNPLLSKTELVNPRSYASELQDPHINFVVTLGETGELEAFLKIKAKDRWMISDPLTTRDHLSIKPFETDLLITWSLSIADDLTSGLDFTIDWNVADPVHRRTLKCLQSSKTVALYFLDASSLSLIGGKALELYQPAIQAEIIKAFALNATLSKDEHQRREQLSSIALSREASMLSSIDKLGLCPQLTGYIVYYHSNNADEMFEHMKTCPRCQQFKRL